MRKYSIQNKIVVPFTLLFVMVMVVSTFITITLFNKKYDECIEKQSAKYNERRAKYPDKSKDLKLFGEASI